MKKMLFLSLIIGCASNNIIVNTSICEDGSIGYNDSGLVVYNKLKSCEVLDSLPYDCFNGYFYCSTGLWVKKIYLNQSNAFKCKEWTDEDGSAFTNEKGTWKLCDGKLVLLMFDNSSEQIRKLKYDIVKIGKEIFLINIKNREDVVPLLSVMQFLDMKPVTRNFIIYCFEKFN